LPGFNSSTVSLDGETAPAPTFFQEPATSPPIYNVPLYDIQSLPMSSHALNITVAPEQASYCWMAFDYAYVNQTSQSPSAVSSISLSLSDMPSSSNTPSSSHTPSSKSHSMVGRVAGGIIAGLAVIAAITFAMIYFRRKKRKAPPITPNEMMFCNAYGVEPQRSKVSLPVMVPTSSFNTPIPVSAFQPSPTHNSQPTLPSGEPSFLSTAPMNITISDSNTASESESPMRGSSNSRALAHSSSPPHVSNSSEQLTDDQVDFVHTLYMHNIPAPSIARVMGRMVGRPDVGAPGRSSTSPYNDSLLPAMAPPSYVA